MKRKASPIATKARRLGQIVDELAQGKNFSITRLTTIKSLCEDPQAAAHFVLHLSGLTQHKMEDQVCPDHLSPDEWSQFKKLASEAILGMEEYLKEPTVEGKSLLWKQMTRIRDVQNEYRNQHWGAVRIIKSTKLLLVEYALRCVLSPSESSYWAYYVARAYAERYNPRYGTGLIPESAPMVADMAEFWRRYDLAMSSNE